MTTLAMLAENPKKEPLPTKRTASLVINIPTKEYSASVSEKERVVQGLRKELKMRFAKLPGHFLMGEWRKQVGPAWPLLCAILCIVDYETGYRRTYVWALAEVMEVSPRNINNWFRKNLIPIGITVTRLRYGIAIQLPQRLIPNIDRKKNSDVVN